MMSDIGLLLFIRIFVLNKHNALGLTDFWTTCRFESTQTLLCVFIHDFFSGLNFAKFVI